MNTRALAAHAACIQAAAQTLPTHVPRTEGQAFARHRADILGNVRLCMLVAHLYNRHWPCDLPGLLQSEDESTTALAMLLLEEYQLFGEDSPDFVALGFEIATAIGEANAPASAATPQAIDEDDGYRFG